MNNPLEAVTQAVNSLVTALKLPDESAKANEVLGEMSFPQFSRLLPYRDYNQESGLFMNDTTMGFMLEAIPINGANESIVEALDHMLRTKLPRGVPFCIHLMSSQLVGDRIEYGLREFSWSGEQAERFNAITRAYYMNAAATQFPLPEGMNLPLTLRHYRVFFSYCSPSKKKSRADILEMENLVKIIRASLQGASITTQAVDAQAFIDIVGEMINHNPDSLYPKRRQLDPYSDLNYQCVEDSFDLKVRADYLTLGLREKGRNSTARILNFHLARNPEIAFLWNMADNYSNLLNPELSISCPFILTLTLVVEDQVKTHSEANLKYMDLEKKSKTSYAKWFPSVEKEAKEWGELRQRLGSGQSSVVSYFLNITAFCKDNNETALEVEQDILNSFRKNGFELISPRFNHMRNFLTCLPFMAGKGLFKQLKEAGVVQRAESFNVANLTCWMAEQSRLSGRLPGRSVTGLPYLNGKPRCRRVCCVNHNGSGKRSGRLPGKICCRNDFSRWNGIWFVTCRKRKPWAETDTGRQTLMTTDNTNTRNDSLAARTDTWLQSLLVWSPGQRDIIKTVALVLMVLDHINLIFQLKQEWMFLAGRGAFPLFALVWGLNLSRHAHIRQVAINRLWGWGIIAQFAYYLAGFPWYEGNILFAFAVAAQVLTWCETRSGWRTAAAILLMALWGPLSGTSYGIAGLLMLAVSHRLYRAEDRTERLALVACLLAVIPALNLATSDAAAVAGLVMTVLTVGLVSCAGKSLPRFWPGDFFPTFYACHLAVLGVLAL